MADPALTDFAPLATGAYLEGLCFDPSREIISYSDVIRGGVHGVSSKGVHKFTLNSDRMWTGGVMMNACGAVLSSGEGGIMWNDPENDRFGWLISEIGDQSINGVNEMWPDGAGGLFFGTCDIEMIKQAKDTRATAIYHLATNGLVAKLAEVHFTNGMVYDQTREKFYCNDTFHGTWSWDVGPDKSLNNRQELLAKTDCDGLALDVNGNIWVTGVYSPGTIAHISPDGKQLRFLEIPNGSATQVRFGGADSRDCYINIVAADAGDNLKDGKPVDEGATLYRCRSTIAGQIVQPANFILG